MHVDAVNTIYNVDSKTKFSNYSKIWFKALIYFELVCN